MERSIGSGRGETRKIPARDLDAAFPAPPPKRRVVLLVYHRDGVEALPLAPGRPVVVGRSAPADLVVADERLSRSHARFTLSDDASVSVEDLGSLNGTILGEARVERAVIQPGDQVLLGALPAVVHALTGDGAPLLGLEGHDAFLSAVESEIARARFFGRSSAVLVVHAGGSERALLPVWCPRVRQLLRPIDRIGFYGAGVVEILLPESTLEDALSLGRAVAARQAGEPSLTCGVAAFPETGSSAGFLLSAAREAARSAIPARPVQAAAPTTVLSRAPAEEANDEIVLVSPAMIELAQTARRLGRSSISVILRGETGSGKEVIARIIHASGPRRTRPLVCVNCAAIPPSLVESTLFGHLKGSFTGAISDRKGVFEDADGGTLLLDEIGELPAPAQAALLRALETKRITRIGSSKETSVDVRVIAATHRDLEAMSQTGGFRSDLFFRLNGMEVTIPPLRERREDIPLLAERFLAREARADGRERMTLSAEASALLLRYAFPGNVRELKNAIERAVVVAEGRTITPRDLPERIRGALSPPEPPSAREGAEPPAGTAEAAPAPPGRAMAADPYTGTLKERLAAFERDAILAALRETEGHQTEAARQLDVPLRTLQFKIKAFGIKKHYDG